MAIAKRKSLQPNQARWGGNGRNLLALCRYYLDYSIFSTLYSDSILKKSIQLLSKQEQKTEKNLE